MASIKLFAEESMAEFPALPLWTDTYLADTRHLTTRQHGAYLLLIMEAWRRPTCSLPGDDDMLRRLAGLSPDEWAEDRDVVMAFWRHDGRSKLWTQKKLLEERDRVRKRSKSQKDKAASRWNKTEKGHAQALPDAMPKQCPDDASISIYSVSKDTGASAPVGDPKKAVFDEGLALLTAGGRPRAQAAALLGKWRKARSDEWLLRAIRSARDGDIGNPVEWIEGAIRREQDRSEARDSYNQHVINQFREMRAAMEPQGDGP